MAKKMILLHSKKEVLWAAVHLTLLIKLVNHLNPPIFCIQSKILEKAKFNNLKSLKKVNFKKILDKKIFKNLIQIQINIKKLLETKNHKIKKNKLLDVRI
jgi:hypothetical protein